MRKLFSVIGLSLLAGCAGMSRDCSSWSAGAMGADWIVVQYPPNAEPNCWILKSTSVANEPASDGVYWKDGKTGNLIHIAGAYARVQVENGQFAEAAASLSLSDCLVETNRTLNTVSNPYKLKE